MLETGLFGLGDLGRRRRRRGGGARTSCFRICRTRNRKGQFDGGRGARKSCFRVCRKRGAKGRFK